MNKVLTTYAAEGQPFLSPTTMNHLQDAISDTVKQSLILSIGDTYDPTKTYRIWGVEQTYLPGPDINNYSEGAIFYNGEIFVSPAQVTSGSLLPGQSIVFVIQETWAAADPILYESGSTHNTHAIRTAKYQIATSGTGIANFGDILNILRPPAYETHSTTTAAITVDFTKNKTVFYANSSSSGNVISIDGTNALRGCEVTLVVAVSHVGDTIAFSGVVYIATGTTSLTATTGGGWIIKLKTLGAPTPIVVAEVYNMD